MKNRKKIEKREPVHRLPLSWHRSRHAKAARDFRPLIPPASQATRKILLLLTGGHSNLLRLTLRKQHTFLWPDVTSLLNIQKGWISYFRINHLKSGGGRVDCIRLFGGHYLVIRLWARSIQPKFPEISVQNSMDRFGPTGKVSKKLVHLLRWSSLVEWIAPSACP